jgi:hypothetical protein
MLLELGLGWGVFGDILGKGNKGVTLHPASASFLDELSSPFFGAWRNSSLGNYSFTSDVTGFPIFTRPRIIRKGRGKVFGGISGRESC